MDHCSAVAARGTNQDARCANLVELRFCGEHENEIGKIALPTRAASPTTADVIASIPLSKKELREYLSRLERGVATNAAEAPRVEAVARELIGRGDFTALASTMGLGVSRFARVVAPLMKNYAKEQGCRLISRQKFGSWVKYFVACGSQMMTFELRAQQWEKVATIDRLFPEGTGERWIPTNDEIVSIGGFTWLLKLMFAWNSKDYETADQETRDEVMGSHLVFFFCFALAG